MNFVFYLHDETSLQNFEQKLLWFRKHYRLVSNKDVEEHLYNGLPLRNSCHITVDDGWLSTYRIIFPVIKKYNIPITIFVSPHIAQTGENFWYKEYLSFDENMLRSMLVEEGIFTSEMKSFPLDLIFKEMKIDDVIALLSQYKHKHNHKIKLLERGFLNVDELREMQDSGLVEIGAHTMTHPILANETSERSWSEIKLSVDTLSMLLNKEVYTFAYPNGLYGLDFTEREMESARRCGLKTAFSVNPGTLNKNISPLSIPRVGSQKRLLLGRMGLHLPTMHDQEKPRRQIRFFRNMSY